MKLVRMLLLAYRELFRFCEKADLNIEKQSLRLSNANQTEKQMNGIIEMINRKLNIINLKIITDNMLDGLIPLKASIIRLVYIERQKMNVVCEKLDINESMYCRTLRQALSDCAKFLADKQIDEEWFFKTYERELWLISFYKSLNSKENRAERLCGVTQIGEAQSLKHIVGV